jgi:hypothetical protein
MAKTLVRWVMMFEGEDLEELFADKEKLKAIHKRIYMMVRKEYGLAFVGLNCATKEPYPKEVH